MKTEGIPYKPKGSQAAKVLKDLKNQYDNPKLDTVEAALFRGALLSTQPMFVGLRGEILHQLALRAARRGEHAKAHSRFEASIKAFPESEVLGLARVLRDFGLFLCESGQHDLGYECIQKALACHDRDVKNAKGQRQRRITQSYAWRAEILVGVHKKQAIAQLVEFALNGCLDCSNRDQYYAVSFALKYAPRSRRPALGERLMDIHANRGKIVPTIVSIAKWVIDIELDIAGRITRHILKPILRER